MEKIEQAQWLVKAFKNLKHETSLWARSGDKEAAKDLMSIVAAENLLLKSLGFALSDSGNIVRYRPLVSVEKEKYNLTLKKTNYLLQTMS